MTQFGANCHCGAQLLSYSTARALEDWALRRCSCDFCRRHQPRYTSDPEGSVRMESRAPLIRYRFGLELADFLTCSICGSYLGAVRSDADGERMVMNANLMGIKELPDEPTAMNYDGEEDSDRAARQRARWTPLEFV